MNFVSGKSERARARVETQRAEFYAQAVEASQRFRAEYQERRNIVKASEMPFERSPDGLIKHIVNEQMNTKECCVDIYMQFLPPAKASGKHRHLSEEVFFVVEGSGYDLHWDVRFNCDDEFEWDWDSEPKRFEWSAGDFVYIPPYCTHQHFNSDAAADARIIVINSRLLKPMGFDWFDQIEPAEGY